MKLEMLSRFEKGVHHCSEMHLSESTVLSSYENWGIQSGCTIKCKDDSTGETKTIIV